MRLIFTRLQKILVVTSLAFAVTLPVFGYLLIETSGLSVEVTLDAKMYDVNGNPLNLVTLKPGTAKILLYAADPTGNVHGEVVRQGKSIRLGGYFYGLGDMTKAEAIEWLGQNVDIYSLGMCGATFKPDDILAIKTLNPLTRFYYMSFATTLFENTSTASPMAPGTWGDSHYPFVHFNETMHGWTVKANDGSEANGVRREDSTSNAHLMDLGSKAWADYFAWIYTNRAREFHADGIATDEVMWRGYWDTDPEDLRDYDSVAEITATCYDWIARVHDQIGVEFTTQAYWDAAQAYQDGVWGEIAFRGGGQYGDQVDDRFRQVWYESMDWEGIVRNLANHSARDRSYIWAAWYERGNAEALEYSLATYLMAKANGVTSTVFHPHPVFDGGYPANLAGYAVQIVRDEVANNPAYYGVELGDALGDMVLLNANGGLVWQRSFENGVVLVNPFHAHLPGFE